MRAVLLQVYGSVPTIIPPKTNMHLKHLLAYHVKMLAPAMIQISHLASKLPRQVTSQPGHQPTSQSANRLSSPKANQSTGKPVSQASGELMVPTPLRGSVYQYIQIATRNMTMR